MQAAFGEPASPGKVNELINIQHFVPEIVERILDGDVPQGISLWRLQKGVQGRMDGTGRVLTAIAVRRENTVY